MSILGLPMEIFDQIMGDFLEAESSGGSARLTVGHRLVCRTFNNFIVNKLCAETEMLTSASIIRDQSETDEYEYRMKLLCSEILCWNVLCGQNKHPLVRALRWVVNVLLKERDEKLVALGYGLPTPEDNQGLRVHYAKSVCDAVKACGGVLYEGFESARSAMAAGQERYDEIVPATILPIARAAIGTSGAPQRVCTTAEDVFSRSRDIFFLPSILDAAVAGNQVETVKKALDFIRQRVRGKKETGTWDGVREASNAIGATLRLAIRMSRDEIGFAIIEFLKEHWHPLGRSVSWSVVGKMYQDCVKYGNTALLATTLYWQSKHELPASPGPSLNYEVATYEFCHMLKRGLPSIIRHVVKTRMIDPNCIRDSDSESPSCGETALCLALEARNYRMATLLIDKGVDIDHVLPGTNKSAYWRARELGNGVDQYCLINWGADFRPMSQHGKPWSEKDKAVLREDLVIYLRRHRVKVRDFVVGHRPKRRVYDGWDW